ncbi:MAG TPA: hypothetical protein VGL99_08285 [Chloroflexota bacterium]
MDGRSGSGKTTLVERVRTAVPGTQVIHTDDFAWWHSRFGWHDLMIDGVFETRHRGAFGALSAAGMGEPWAHWAHRRVGTGPWERATIIVAGTTDVSYDPMGEVVIAAPRLAGRDAA